MAKFILINTVIVATTTFFAGSVIDDAAHDKAGIEASGGVLVAEGDAIVDDAAERVRALRANKASNENLSDTLMLAAYLKSHAKFLDNAKGAVGAALTDADATIQIGEGAWRRLPAATLGATRTVTLGTTGAVAGDQITITRLDTTANTFVIVNGGAGAGTLYTFPVSVVGGAKFQFDGTNWALREV